MDSELAVSDKDSIETGAGSIYSALREIRTVQIVHETIRKFFREDGSFALKEVSPDGTSDFIKGNETI